MKRKIVKINKALINKMLNVEISKFLHDRTCPVCKYHYISKQKKDSSEIRVVKGDESFMILRGHFEKSSEDFAFDDRYGAMVTLLVCPKCRSVTFDTK